MATKKITELGVTENVLDSDTLLAIRGKAVQRVKKSDLTRGLATEEDLAVERARIDKFGTLEEGSTTGDAELQDIRIGANGETYGSAGEAVRTQIKNLSDKIDEGGLNLEDLELSVAKNSNSYTIFMSDGKVEKTADIPHEVDGMLSQTSTNPVQNRVIAQEINAINEEIEIIKNEGVGGEAGTTIRLTNQNGTSTLVSSYGNACVVMFTFTSTEDDLPTGNGNCKITVNGVSKVNMSIPQGLTAIDVSPYLAIGSNSVIVSCTDVFGKTRSLAYDITVIKLTIESTFDSTVPYNGDIIFKYTPYGAIEKTIHFVIDGEEVGTVKTSLSGKQATRTIPAMSHGSHKLEVYSTATMEENELQSPILTYDIICLETGNTTPIIASVYTIETLSQGEQISIPYIVYDPTKLACDITLTVYTMESGSEVVYSTQTITVDRGQKYWNTRKYPVGNVYFKIQYGDITKTHCIVIEESKIKIEAETNDLELYLSSEGRSNNETNPDTWTYGDIETNFSNMNWNSVGWIHDENGDTCLRLNGDARAEIQFQPFSEDIRTYGKTIELEFVVRDVNNRDATVISCISGGIGFEVKADTAYIASEQSRVFCNYKDEEKVRLAFVIESRSEYRLLSIYLNGILSDAIQYPTTDNFQQLSPVNISIGSSNCGIDLYVVRSYTTALTSQSVVTNYIADMPDIVSKTEVYEENDIYDEYGNVSFVKAKEKNSVMVIVGDLPQSKGDKKKGSVVYYDVDDSNLDFTDTMTIDVQGTSSQYYVRKNWKIKFPNEHQIDIDQVATKVICLKVDYAEATGTHNTQNANFIQTLYSEPIPPQVDNPKVRTTIYGKPILLFHQPSEGEDPIFYGKANFNFDKGSEEAFGFNENWDVESWEFCNNTSDACNFLGEIPDNWSDDFEARYPDGCEDISRFKVMHDWVVSTKGNVTKFKDEFEQYFDLHYALIYYVYTFVALMVDQRAKNMFLTYWGATDKWYPYFYDNDTSFGINNEGQLVFDYYHEDTDTLDGANVYNGQNSVLWCNFREAYPDEIKETYQQLRNDGLITYDKLEEQFITKGSDKWSESIYNEDSEFKYISMLRTDNDASNLPQVRGSGEEHFKYFIENRLNYLDSKWYASDYANDYVSLRIYTPSTWQGVKPNANITLIPYSNMYAGVRYKANGTLYQQRVEHSIPVTFEAPNETFNDTETAIYGASQLSSLGDLAPLYCGSINVANASKLTELKIGDGTTGYSNNNLKELSVGTNKLLKKIDVRNCPSLVSPLGLSGCPNIEEVYATGSGITAIELTNSGCLRIAKLPATITNLTLRNQVYIEEFTLEGYDALKTLWVENCPSIDTLTILDNAPNIERVRLTNVDWSCPDASILYELIERNIAGIDENGTNIDNMWIDGACHIGTLTGAEMKEINELFPFLTITYDHLESQLVYIAPVDLSCSVDNDGILTFNSDVTVDENGVLIVHPNAKPTVDENGVLTLPSGDVWVEVYRETITNGGDGTNPVDSGKIEAPQLEETVQYSYTFNGWTFAQGNDVDENALLHVEADRNVYAAFEKTIRNYTVNFYNGTTLLETQQVPYGSVPTYGGETPIHPDEPDYCEFTGWSPEPSAITGDVNYYAQYYDTREITDSWETIAANCNNGTATSKYAIGAYKPVEITYEDGTSETIDMEVIAHNHDELADGSYKWESVGNLPCHYGNVPSVVYNGEIHIFNETSHYKYNGTEWSTVGTTPIKFGASSMAVYNNEIHVMGGTSNLTAHYKYDGTEWTEVETLSFESANGCAVVYNNEIHVLGGYWSGTLRTYHYIYNGTEWTQVNNVPTVLSKRAVVYNDEIHAINNMGVHYKYDGSEWTNIGTVPINQMCGYAIVYNDAIYSFANDTLSKYDGVEWVELGLLPFNINYRHAVVYNNEIHLIGGNSYYDSIKHWKWSTKAWVSSIPSPVDWKSKTIVYKNELYVLGDQFSNKFRKWNGESWENLDIEVPINPNDAVVYNDELHLFNGTNHYKWDGSTWSEVSTIPISFSGTALVWNDKIHLLGSETNHYAWNGTEWTSISTLPVSFSWGNLKANAAVYNNELYAIMSTGTYVNMNFRLYKFNGTEWIEESIPPALFKSSAMVVYDNKIHFIGSNNGNLSNVHYTWDGSNWENESTLPFNLTDGTKHAVVYRGKLYICMNSRSMSYYSYQNPKATLTFMAKNALTTTRKMDSNAYYYDGWSTSDLHTWCNDDLFNALPSDLQGVIKTVSKLVDGGYNNQTISKSFDNIWIASMDELGFSTSDTHIVGQGECYPTFTDNASRLRCLSGSTSAINWWTRTHSLSNQHSFRYIMANGWHNNIGQIGNIHIVFGFCI